MKLYSTLLLSLVLALNTAGQTKPDLLGFTNKAEAKNQRVNGFKEGKWLEYLDSNNVTTKDTNAPYYSLSVYKTEINYGTSRAYYNKSGKLYIECPYDAYGAINGVTKKYFENGVMQFEASYYASLRNGPEKEYYRSGKLKRIYPYDANGLMNDTMKLYYENGILQGECPMKNGVQNGLQQMYFPYGKIQIQSPYTNGKIDGVVKEYFSNGVLGSETIYVNGIEGRVHYYDKNGVETELKQK